MNGSDNRRVYLLACLAVEQERALLAALKVVEAARVISRDWDGEPEDIVPLDLALAAFDAEMAGKEPK